MFSPWYAPLYPSLTGRLRARIPTARCVPRVRAGILQGCIPLAWPQNGHYSLRPILLYAQKRLTAATMNGEVPTP